MDLRGFAWIAVDLHGFAWIGVQDLWICMDLHGFAWICVDWVGKQNPLGTRIGVQALVRFQDRPEFLIIDI